MAVTANITSKDSGEVYALSFEGGKIQCTCKDYIFRRSENARTANPNRFLGGVCKHAKQWIAELEAEVSAERTLRLVK